MIHTSPEENNRLERSRAALRRALGQDDSSSTALQTSSAFPRSTTMRLLVAPEYAWIRVAAMSIASTLVMRKLPRVRGGALLAGLAVLRRLVSDRRGD